MALHSLSFFLSYCHQKSANIFVYFRALSWPDSGTSFKAAMLTAPMVRQLLANGSVSDMVATHIMTSVLQGLQLHGHHDVNQSVLVQLGTQVYDMLRPRFIEVVEVGYKFSCLCKSIPHA